jgi:hypothetical protein
MPSRISINAQGEILHIGQAICKHMIVIYKETLDWKLQLIETKTRRQEASRYVFLFFVF